MTGKKLWKCNRRTVFQFTEEIYTILYCQNEMTLAFSNWACFLHIGIGCEREIATMDGKIMVVKRIPVHHQRSHSRGKIPCHEFNGWNQASLFICNNSSVVFLHSGRFTSKKLVQQNLEEDELNVLNYVTQFISLDLQYTQ